MPKNFKEKEPKIVYYIKSSWGYKGPYKNKTPIKYGEKLLCYELIFKEIIKK